MFKAIGTILILWWLSVHLPATFLQLDTTGSEVLSAIAKIATTTANNAIQTSGQMPQVAIH